MLKADFSVKVRECVTSPGFLHWFMSNKPVFGHKVLVPQEKKGRVAGNEAKMERGKPNKRLTSR